MKKLISILSLVIILASFFVAGCSKNEDPIPPTITFKQDAGYVSANTTANYGDTLNFGITAKSNGTDNLAKFQIFANGQQMLDSTINTTTFALDVTTVKAILDKEVWKFVTTDIAGNSKTDSIVITGTFGEILTYSSKTLGAQSNTTEKGFISYSNSTATQYTQDEAFNHQADIDMFCFYENTATSVNMMTLAAPGSNIKGIFTGATSVELYTVKNITFYVKTTLTAAQFDAVANDAVIRASFDPTKQFKKAKLLTAGDVYSFKLQSGKYGLLKVIAVAGAEAGTLQIAVKIQK
ncbi:MAG: hypothetical protein ACOYLO_14940 [Ferruginibacter sp.]